jgi:hypothetical protein
MATSRGITPIDEINSDDSPRVTNAGGEEEGIIRCICGYDFDDGFTIQCDDCLVWQHSGCVDISYDNVPKEYLCERCSPRVLDVKVGGMA